MSEKPIDLDTYTTEELLKMSKEEACKGLSERQMRFCEAYFEGHNRKIALAKSGYDGTHSAVYAYRMLRSPKIQRYIQWLKAKSFNHHMVKATDVLDEWIRIAFSDVTDFVNIRPNSISLKPAEQVDGQLIKSVRSTRDGVVIELHDKMKALDSLAKYLEDMPKEWRQKIEERKLELMEQDFELKKKSYELENPQSENDGFIEAIKAGCESIWDENI